MSARELVVLGSASQAPTRHRNHNGYLLRWDGEGILFDPGEGTQRQFTLAGVSAATTTRICISHFHGDHCLGLPGMIMRLALDQGHLPVPIHYPASGDGYFQRLRFATPGQEQVPVDARPTNAPAVVHAAGGLTIRAIPLRHTVDAIGWRVEEADRRRVVPELAAARGVEGPAIGRLLADGSIDVDGATVHVDEVTVERRGLVFASVMDTAWCDGAVELAGGADLLLCESTFLATEVDMAVRYGHLTAAEAGRLASDGGARVLVLTHFSQRYADVEMFRDEAAREFDGEIVLAEDFLRVGMPAHR